MSQQEFLGFPISAITVIRVITFSCIGLLLPDLTGLCTRLYIYIYKYIPGFKTNR